ncbi:MAG: DUF1998 domain-containing protein, partial [Actinomycetota bacterium]|nr:DUF1998 domain-containing protein [Actinomycetota bacterium]
MHARPTPAGACTKMHCGGTVERADPPADDYNVALLSRPFTMVTAEEHTAQVPVEDRLRIEGEFKRRGGPVNTLVASPTLELGVDIGALDLVLCRNVPPTPASYWQRVGRAGRRRRMAVVLVYCRRAVHDTYFFERPRELLDARLRPPRFNLKNDVLVRKHVHAIVLGELLRLARDDAATGAALEATLPLYVRDLLFAGEDDRPLAAPVDMAPLGAMLDRHRALLVSAVKRVFAAGWPAEAAAEADPERLEVLVARTAADLQEHVDHLHQRLRWVLDTLQRLALEEAERGAPLGAEEQKQQRRCRQYVEGLKRRDVRTYTLSVLAGEGFLPGYGLYDGGISAFPGWRGGTTQFELSRPPAVAVREFVPGNLLYANRGRYRANRFHFPASGEARATDGYVLDAESGQLRLAGAASPGYADDAPVAVEGLPVADVDLEQLGAIRDEETERFQLPVTVLGLEVPRRRGGTAWRFGETDVHHVLGQGLRLVNVGPADRVRAGAAGYPICTVCGAARSPYASDRELQNFEAHHRKSCGRAPGRLALSADVNADALRFRGLHDQEAAANLGEAVRLGAAQVLQMEPDDLQTLPVRADDGRTDLFVYDPMPGGSGLLVQVIERWAEIAAKLEPLLRACPNACERSCHACLRTGRNVFWHRTLDRHRALELVWALGDAPEPGHELPALEDPAAGRVGAATTNAAEDRLRDLLRHHGLTGFVGQHAIEIGEPFGRSVPDFAWVDERVAVYLDGLSAAIHGDADRARTDALIRDLVEDAGWEVVQIAASHLDDPRALALDLKRIARKLSRREVARTIDETTVLGKSGSAEEDGAGSVQPYVRHVPVYSIRAAAGRFLAGAPAEPE